MMVQRDRLQKNREGSGVVINSNQGAGGSWDFWVSPSLAGAFITHRLFLDGSDCLQEGIQRGKKFSRMDDV